jgi:hypothetical protein
MPRPRIKGSASGQALCAVFLGYRCLFLSVAMLSMVIHPQLIVGLFACVGVASLA